MTSPQLFTKLDQLFEQRQITTYAKHMGLSENVINELLDTLRGLQVIIYEVDSSLEQTRHIDAKFTSFSEQKRTEIEQVVTIVTGSKDHTDQLLKRLRTFFQMELQMREGVSPVTIPIDIFYSLKICDIHLQRELTNISAHKQVREDVWSALEAYDKVGEVIDDLEDTEEDMESINSNRFLLSMYEIGFHPTKEEYLTYLQQLEKTMFPYEEEIITLLGSKAVDPQKLLEQARHLIKKRTLPHGRVPLLVKLLEEKTAT